MSNTEEVRPPGATGAKPAKSGAVRRLLSDAALGHVGDFAQAIGCMLVVAGSTAALAWLLRHVVNEVLVARNQPLMWATTAGILAVSLARGLADYRQTVLLARMGSDLVMGLQKRIFDKVLALGVEEVGRSHSAKLINRLITHAGAARNVLTRVLTSFGRDLLTVILLIGVMMLQDLWMGLAAIVVGPVAILGLDRLMRRIRELASREQKSTAGVVQSMQETVQGMRAVKSYTAEDAMRRRFAAAAEQARALANDVVRVRAWTSPLMEGLGGTLIAGFVIYSGWQTIAANKSPGEFIAFLLAFVLAYEPAKRLANAHVLLQRDIAGVEKMYEFLDRPDVEPREDPRPPLQVSEGRIVFEDVRFGYSADRPVLEGFTLDIAPGELVALVGASGVGKTTVTALLQGFYGPWSGRVIIDGQELAAIDPRSLRAQIAVVGQDVAMFAGTIADNIALGRPGAQAAEIEAAARAAGALDFIGALPHGFDTLMGERGTTLSGGQLQRISIARAMLKNAPILILDEATSALDGDTERQVRDAIERLRAGRTTLVVAHRQTTIESADRICVLVDGAIAAQGKYADLRARSAEFNKLFGV